MEDATAASAKTNQASSMSAVERTRPAWKAHLTQIGDQVVYDVIIIGAGAAGLMCAAEASKRSRRVAVLEHNAEIGRKILISGGRPVQLHKLGLQTGELHLLQSAFSQVGSCPIYVF